jgi:hypothetical protein
VNRRSYQSKTPSVDIDPTSIAVEKLRVVDSRSLAKCTSVRVESKYSDIPPKCRHSGDKGKKGVGIDDSPNNSVLTPNRNINEARLR